VKGLINELLTIMKYVLDLENMVQQMKFVRSLREIEPWASGTVKEIDPGLDISTDEQIRGMNVCSLPARLLLKRRHVDYILNHHETSWRKPSLLGI
jgi:hypothetical protein